MNRQFQFNHPVWEIIAFSSPEKWNEMNNARISIRDYWRIKEKYKREMDILCKQVGRIRKKYRKTYDTDTLKQLNKKESEYNDVFQKYWYYKK